MMNNFEHFLKNLWIEGGTAIKLPNVQYPVGEYAKIKKTMEQIGGSWSTTEQAFVFPVDPTERIEQLKSGNKVNLKQNFQFFETPIYLIGILWLMVQQEQGGIQHDTIKRVLEPSAGRGNILKWMKVQGWDPDYCELMIENQQILFDKGYTRHVAADFLSYYPDTSYDLIIANPPFNKGQDIRHFKHMVEVVRDGGFIGCIMSKPIYEKQDFCIYMQENSYSWTMDQVFPKDFEEREIFGGTTVGCTLVSMKVKHLL
jgi:hypothetical protein